MSECSLTYHRGMSTTRAAALPPDQRRRTIVDAVIPLLVEYGESVTTRQIATAAGIAEGTIFRVFPDKPALLLAAARAVMDPDERRRALAGIDPDLPLAEKVRAVAEEMLGNMQRVIAVLMAVRSSLAPDEHAHPGARRTGPPQFVVEANQALLATLTEVFEQHRTELRVPPDRAALMLRSLVFGSRHPGMGEQPPLTADEVAALLVHGIGGTDPEEH